jgi:hypothetical protein
MMLMIEERIILINLTGQGRTRQNKSGQNKTRGDGKRGGE